MVVLIHISVQTLIPMAAAPASPPWPARFAALLRIAQVSIFGLSPGATDIFDSYSSSKINEEMWEERWDCREVSAVIIDNFCDVTIT